MFGPSYWATIAFNLNYTQSIFHTFYLYLYHTLTLYLSISHSKPYKTLSQDELIQLIIYLSVLLAFKQDVIKAQIAKWQLVFAHKTSNNLFDNAMNTTAKNNVCLQHRQPDQEPKKKGNKTN